MKLRVSYLWPSYVFVDLPHWMEAFAENIAYFGTGLRKSKVSLTTFTNDN